MYKIIDFTDDLTAFAKGVLNALYKEDRFLTLYAAGTYVNTGWPSDEGYDSCIGFEKEIKTLISNDPHPYYSVAYEFSLEDLFFCELNEEEFTKFKNNKNDYAKEYEGVEGIYILNGLPHKMCHMEFSENGECYPDGTSKVHSIRHIEVVVNKYYPQYSVIKKLIEDKYRYALVVS
mgnify:CR=1 FL=1|jgi:hypothetical protein